MDWPPPGLFSTLTGTLTILLSWRTRCIARPIRSLAPPAAAPITSSTGRSGFQAAWGACASATAGNRRNASKIRFMISSSEVVLVEVCSLPSLQEGCLRSRRGGGLSCPPRHLAVPPLPRGGEAIAEATRHGNLAADAASNASISARCSSVTPTSSSPFSSRSLRVASISKPKRAPSGAVTDRAARSTVTPAPGACRRQHNRHDAALHAVAGEDVAEARADQGAHAVVEHRVGGALARGAAAE